MTAAAISADYVDLKFIKTRKLAQIILEIPIEQAGAFVEAFGTPNPATSVPVALARLGKGVVQDDTLSGKPKRRMDELPLSQQAALMCDKPAFWRFVNERHGQEDIDSEPLAAAYVRSYCGVQSRADIKPGIESGRRFFLLQAEFDTWLRAPV